MQRAIRRYIEKESININSELGKDNINRFFDLIDHEIDLVRRVEIKKAREKKLREWRRKEKLNRRHNNKKLGR